MHFYNILTVGQLSHLIAICSMNAFDKQYCTSVSVVQRCVLQNYFAMIARIFPHCYQCSAAIRLLYAQRLLMISNIAQMYHEMHTAENIATTFLHGYHFIATIRYLTIAYDKQNCTNVLIMRCVMQNNIAMIASTFPHGYQCSVTIRLLYAQRLLMNIAQECLL